MNFIAVEGWYRDCGIIPHTTDADLMLRANDYDEKIIEKFKGDKLTPLFSTLGLLNDSLEIRLTNSKKPRFTYDLFLAYEFSEKELSKINSEINLQWSGFQNEKRKFR